MIYDKSISEIEENGKSITLISLAIPLLLENLLLQFYSTANTLLLKGYSENAVTAAAVSESILNIAVVLFTMVIKGAVILTSVFLGRSDRQTAARITGNALAAVSVISVFLSIGVYALAPELISAMNLKGATANDAVSYLRIRSSFMIFTAIMSFFNNMLIANGYSKNTMLVGVISNALNILFCYISLYTTLPLPFEGIRAVAVSSVLSQLIGAVIALLFFVKTKCPISCR